MITQATGGVLIAAAGWHDEAPGGANRIPTDFARALADRGRRVVYVCPSPLVAAPQAQHVDGVDLWRYPSPRGASPSAANLWRHVRLTASLVREALASCRITALSGHNPLQYLAASNVCGAPVRRAYTVHSPFVDEQRAAVAGRPGPVRQLALRGADAIERRVLKASHVVHYLSTFTRQRMEAAYPRLVAGKGVVLPGWVDLRRFPPRVEPAAAVRARLAAPWQPDVPAFFTLRRLEPRMGLDTLLEAAAILAAERRAFHVVIGGDGSERPALEARARALALNDRVAFLGRVPAERLVLQFAAADAFVLPTRALECFGLIVLESFACGVPVVGVPVGAIPEVIGPELVLWIAADNTAPSIAARMREVLDGRLTADPARLRARAEAFDLRAIEPRYERVLLDGVPDDGAAGRPTQELVGRPVPTALSL